MQVGVPPPTTIDAYISQFPKDIQILLNNVRKTIKQSAPNASEAIKYQMPTFVLQKNLVHFAACKDHLGFYPTPSAIMAFADDLKDYKTSKGAIQFPLDKPIPFELIQKIVLFRVGEVEGKQK